MIRVVHVREKLVTHNTRIAVWYLSVLFIIYKVTGVCRLLVQDRSLSGKMCNIVTVRLKHHSTWVHSDTLPALYHYTMSFPSILRKKQM